ncbi:MAG: response regulator [Calditrichaeota bacterium]|nr:response regulator [Calditrichota bacterium]
MRARTKLLIVDDSLTIRQAIERNLKEFSLEVVGSTGNGKTALELFRNLEPDVVTLDITMPELDGITVLEEMMKMRNDVKIMVITALKDKATGLRAIQIGAKSYLVKPFTSEKLKAAFARMLGTN